MNEVIKQGDWLCRNVAIEVVLWCLFVALAGATVLAGFATAHVQENDAVKDTYLWLAVGLGVGALVSLACAIVFTWAQRQKRSERRQRDQLFDDSYTVTAIVTPRGSLGTHEMQPPYSQVPRWLH